MKKKKLTTKKLLWIFGLSIGLPMVLTAAILFWVFSDIKIPMLDHAAAIRDIRLTNAANGEVLFVPKAHRKLLRQRSVGGPLGGRTSSRAYRSIYYLAHIDPQTFQTIREEPLALVRANYGGFSMLGFANDLAWFTMGTPQAYNIKTLEKVADLDILEAQNPDMKGLFPPNGYDYRFDVMRQKVYFTALDGTNKQIDNQSLKVVPLGHKPNDPDEPIAKIIADAKTWHRNSLQDLTYNFVVNGNEIMGLFDEQEWRQMVVNRNLYRYNTERIRKIGIGNRQNVNSFRLLGQPQFLKGAFIIDPDKKVLMHLPQNDSYFIHHKKNITDTSAVVISAVNGQGKLLWQRPMPVFDIGSYILKDHTLLFVAAENRDFFSRDFYEMIGRLDLRTGELQLEKMKL
jgi:hypothetical protein